MSISGRAAPKVSQPARAPASIRAPVSRANRRLAAPRSAPRRSAPSRLAPRASARSSNAPLSTAPSSSARTSVAPRRSASCRSPPLRRASVRSAPASTAEPRSRRERSRPASSWPASDAPATCSPSRSRTSSALAPACEPPSSLVAARAHRTSRVRSARSHRKSVMSFVSGRAPSASGSSSPAASCCAACAATSHSMTDWWTNANAPSSSRTSRVRDPTRCVTLSRSGPSAPVASLNVAAAADTSASSSERWIVRSSFDHRCSAIAVTASRRCCLVSVGAAPARHDLLGLVLQPAVDEQPVELRGRDRPGALARRAQVLGRQGGDEPEHARVVRQAEQILDVLDEREALAASAASPSRRLRNAWICASSNGCSRHSDRLGTSSARSSSADLTWRSDSKCCVRLVTTTFASPPAACTSESKCSVARR